MHFVSEPSDCSDVCVCASCKTAPGVDIPAVQRHLALQVRAPQRCRAQALQPCSSKGNSFCCGRSLPVSDKQRRKSGRMQVLSIAHDEHDRWEDGRFQSGY